MLHDHRGQRYQSSDVDEPCRNNCFCSCNSPDPSVLGDGQQIWTAHRLQLSYECAAASKPLRSRNWMVRPRGVGGIQLRSFVSNCSSHSTQGQICSTLFSMIFGIANFFKIRANGDSLTSVHSILNGIRNRQAFTHSSWFSKASQESHIEGDWSVLQAAMGLHEITELVRVNVKFAAKLDVMRTTKHQGSWHGYVSTKVD